MEDQKMNNVTTNVSGKIRIEGAKLIFRNFRGKGTEFNDEGNRNFGVLLDDDLAESLLDDGWKVKYLRPQEDDPDQYSQPWLPVKVKFNKYPPRIVMITSRGKVPLDEDTVDQLDWSRIVDCDLVITPYNYPALKGRPAGVAAYLQTLYVTISEDAFEEKYADIPFLGESKGEANEE